MKTKLRKVVIPVAGLGTRGLPFTKEVPKELIPVIDTPAIHFIVEEVLAAGIDQIIFVTAKGKSALEDYFDLSPQLEDALRKKGNDVLADQVKKIGSQCEVISIRQKSPLGLGHAIACARSVVGDEMFAVCLGDEIFPQWFPRKQNGLQKLVEAALRMESSVVGVMEVPKSETGAYGIIDIGGKILAGEPVPVQKTIEKPKPELAPSHYAIIGRYVFRPEIFDNLARLKPGVGGEFQLTDAMAPLCRAGALYAMAMEGPRFDVGNHLSYLKASIEFAFRRPELADGLKSYLKSL